MSAAPPPPPPPASAARTGGSPPPRFSFVAVTTSAARTRQLAAAVAGCCGPGDVVLLSGGLGAGKTVFAQGFAAALGVVGPVTSPTFTLVREYRCAAPARSGAGPQRLLHADVYRLETLDEVADLALGELVETGAVALVEWGDAAAPVLGTEALTVALERPPGAGEGVRRVRVSGEGVTWADRRREVQRALEGFAPGAAAPAVPDGPLGTGEPRR